MEINAADRAAIRLTLRLATVTTLVLLLIGTPLAWWLARSAHWLKGVVGALVAMPLVLPPPCSGSTCWCSSVPRGP